MMGCVQECEIIGFFEESLRSESEMSVAANWSISMLVVEEGC